MGALAEAAFEFSRRAPGRAERIAGLAHALSRLHGEQRDRVAPLLDEEGSPLYRDLKGRPTSEPWVNVPMVDAHGEALFEAPPEMQRDPYVRFYRRDELWSRHYARLPQGALKLDAWTADPHRRGAQPHKLALIEATRNGGSDQVWGDAEQLFAEGKALAREMENTLDDATRILTESIRAELRRARRCLDGGLDVLSEVVGDWVASDSGYRGLFDDDLPDASAFAVAEEPYGTLLQRLELARLLDPWLRSGAPSRPLDCDIHPGLLACLQSCLAGAGPTSDGVAQSIVALLRAERMRKRGSEAFGAMGQETVAEELALELAIVGLQRAIEGTLSRGAER